ncbi:MAG: dTDP-4-dehydrorhamnose 3,5-epimerase [Gammaproteobacteria bacterium]|nr:dTDP-4-dehydrorhamnose 3,5-epimerase [Gammaproteobacteria bacterium]|tara:strand:+ start:351 stop:887 length:537 start_codon:yes stop_codon:yes gene_type:complete
MKVQKTKLNNCFIIEPDVHEDDRGFFLETYSKKRYFDEVKISKEFVQDNHSKSSYGTLRGLHFQIQKPQGKLVRVLNGQVYDVVVDLRKDSSSFGQWIGVYLDDTNKKQLWVPEGFAHGFVVTSEYADFEYKCTEYYRPNDEGCLLWSDPDINISWPIKKPNLSEKDKDGMLFKNLNL